MGVVRRELVGWLVVYECLYPVGARRQRYRAQGIHYNPTTTICCRQVEMYQSSAAQIYPTKHIPYSFRVVMAVEWLCSWTHGCCGLGADCLGGCLGVGESLQHAHPTLLAHPPPCVTCLIIPFCRLCFAALWFRCRADVPKRDDVSKPLPWGSRLYRARLCLLPVH